MNKNEIIFIIALVLFISISITVYLLFRNRYSEFEPQNKEDEERIIEYRKNFLTDIIQHICFWLNLQINELTQECTLTPDGKSTIYKMCCDLYEIVLISNWYKRTIDVDIRYFIADNSKYVSVNDSFKVRHNIPPYDNMYECIVDFQEQIMNQIYKDYVDLIQDLTYISTTISKNAEVSNKEMNHMLFEASVIFKDFLTTNVLVRNKDFAAALSKLIAYIDRYYHDDYMQFLADECEGQLKMSLMNSQSDYEMMKEGEEE